MKVLVCADIHGRRDWWEWVADNIHQCDVVLLAGDLIGEVEFPSDLEDPWTRVKDAVDHLEQSGVMVCLAEGNHDEMGEHGPWFYLRRKSRKKNNVWFVGLPWQDTEDQWADDLRHAVDRAKELLVVLQHDPPLGTRVSVPGHWKLAPYHAFDFNPHIIVCGHMHEAPFSRGGSWWDRQGNIYFFNPGHFARAMVPCHIVLDFTAMTATWYAPLGRKAIQLEGLS